jgi:hypothetical protein
MLTRGGAASTREEVMTLSKIGRSAVTGRFTSVRKAEAYPTTHVVETIKKT